MKRLLRYRRGRSSKGSGLFIPLHSAALFLQAGPNKETLPPVLAEGEIRPACQGPYAQVLRPGPALSHRRNPATSDSWRCVLGFSGGAQVSSLSFSAACRKKLGSASWKRVVAPRSLVGNRLRRRNASSARPMGSTVAKGRMIRRLSPHGFFLCRGQRRCGTRR